jgi:hypothetical protein
VRRAGAIAARALLAVLAAAAALAFPRAMHDGPRPPPPAVAGAPGCEVAPCAADDDGLVARIGKRLALEMPGLEEPARRELARAIVGEAAAARIDPLLVLAVIEVESSFEADARSHRGAAGLMQLREATFDRELERSGLPAAEPHEPVANVRAGVRYLRRLLDAFGREEVALMAYNAGPNRILGYLRDEGGIPERFEVYPRRVRAEHRRLRRALADPAPQGAGAPGVYAAR